MFFAHEAELLWYLWRKCVWVWVPWFPASSLYSVRGFFWPRLRPKKSAGTLLGPTLFAGFLGGRVYAPRFQVLPLRLSKHRDPKGCSWQTVGFLFMFISMRWWLRTLCTFGNQHMTPMTPGAVAAMAWYNVFNPPWGPLAVRTQRHASPWLHKLQDPPPRLWDSMGTLTSPKYASKVFQDKSSILWITYGGVGSR